MMNNDDNPQIIPFPTERMTNVDQLDPTRIGLIAGGGRFPIEFAQSAQAAGHSVFALGIAGIAWPELEDSCENFRTIPLGRMGKAIRTFKRAGIQRIVMAGKIEKMLMFRSFRWLRLMPDFRTLHMWFRYAKENKKDDTILLAIIREFERDGFYFDSALDYAPELLVKHGFLTSKKPSQAQWKDIQFGFDMAREMGRLDIGQTVVVNDQAVIAVEAIEGTDRCIRRSAELCKRGGFTVVKVAKPNQDMRFDVPTIGADTIQSMHESGGRVLAIETGMTIIIDPDEVAKLADQLGIVIVSVKSEELEMRVAA